MKVQRTKKGNLVVVDKYSFNCAVIGMLLGDASLRRYVRKTGPESCSKKGPFWNTTNLCFEHTKEKEQYGYWKVELVKAYINNFSICDKVKKIEDKTHYGTQFLLRHRKNFHYIYKKFYCGGEINNNYVIGATKIIKDSVLSRVNDLSLAIWYMDDGSLYTYHKNGHTYRTLSLHTDCFTYEECEKVQNMFYDRFNIEFNINHNGTTDKKFDRGYKLRCHKSDSVFNFLELVYDYVCDVPCMRYKLP